MSTPEFKPVELTKDLLDGWERQDRKNQRAVVFVHGFMGDPLTTWKAANAAKSFPELLIDDPGLSDFDTFRFKYKTSPFSGPNIQNIARQFEEEVISSLAGYQLVLLAHSMGGLVCMQYIVDQLERGRELPVMGFLMFGTPTTGVEWIKIAKLVAELGSLKLGPLKAIKWLFNGNAQFKELCTASQFLQDLQSDWILRVVNGGYPSELPSRRGWIPVKVVTGNEDWVVKEHSAKGIYGQIDWAPVQVDHRSLVKPTDRKHVCYKRAADFIADCRYSCSAEVLENLRGQSDWVWSLRQTKLIRDWKYEIRFYAPGQQPSDSSLKLEGFSVCEVKCRYKLRLTDLPFILGITLGRDAARTAWEANPAYLHQIFLSAIKSSEREAVSKAVSDRLTEKEGPWDSLFENVLVRLAEDEGGPWHNLEKRDLEMSENHMVNYYHLPEEVKPLIDREVVLDLGFRSLRPNSMNNFTLDFPWLTDGFNALVVIHGKTDYLVAAPQMFGPTKPIIDTDDVGDRQKVRIDGSKQLVLPESSVYIEWLPS